MDEDDDIPPLVSAADWARTPLDVKQAFVTLVDMVRDLSARLRDLEAQLKQTSRNTSKPPSSDPPSALPAPPRVLRGTPIGAQKGHPDQQRPLLPPEQVDEVIVCQPQCWRDCASALTPNLPDALPPTRAPVGELPPLRAHITEYQCRIVICPTCQQLVIGVRPDGVPPGPFGP